MNNDPLEERLKRTQPAPLPKDLMARLIMARPQPATPPSLPLPMRGFWRFTLVETFVLSAILLALVGMSFPLIEILQNRSAQIRARLAAQANTNIAAAAPVNILLPVEQRNILVSAEDIGIVGADTAHPVRLVRTVWVDDATFRSSDGHSNARLTQPRERIIPVSLETY